MLAIAGVVLGLHVFLDGPPPDDADLMPDPIPLVAPEDSVRAGLVDLYTRMQATQPEGWVEDFDLHGWIWEEAGSPGSATLAPLDRGIWTPELASRFDLFLPWIDRHLADLDAILARPAHGSWIPHDANARIADGLQEGRKLGMILRGRAQLARMQGDLAQAFRHLESLRGLGESYMYAGTSLVEFLVGGLLSSMAIEGVRALLHDADGPAELERRWLATPPSLDRDATVVARTLRAEYAMLSNSIHLRPDHWPGLEFTGRLFLKVNHTRSILAREYRALIELTEESGLPRSDRRRGAAPFLQLSPRWRAVLRANSGELIVPWVVPSTELLLGRFDRMRFSERVLRLQIALRVHERTHGVLPPNLAALVSSGILPADASWIDPLSGNPLRYDAERRILWSVGENGIDDDGAGWEELRADPERWFRLPDWVGVIPPLPGN